jgi:formylmethanofuran dehydrogenase subunit B
MLPTTPSLRAVAALPGEPERSMTNPPADDHAVCLGCGCLCDDITATVQNGRITRLAGVCPLGEKWFGDGVFPDEIRVGDRAAPLGDALNEATSLLRDSPGRLLVYVAGDVTCEAIRETVALADRLGASIDGPTSDTVAEGLLTAQRRGRATGTLGELRHRADAILFWAVDPDLRYPRFMERFVNAPALLTASRRLIAIDVNASHGPQVCPERLSLDPTEEVDALCVMRGAVLGRPLAELPPALAAAADLARRLATEAKYVGIVFDAEPKGDEKDDGRTEGFITLAQALNGPTRAAAWGLRAGGNRNGFESVLTWQTGYPFAVDFGRGFPSYVADETAAERLARGRYSSALVLGDPATVPQAVAEQLRRVATVAVGPRASTAQFDPRVAIDTGAASLHEDGLVLRMDDVPIQARGVLPHSRTITEVLQALSVHVPTLPLAEVG